MANRERPNGQTMIYNTLQRKQKNIATQNPL